MQQVVADVAGSLGISGIALDDSLATAGYKALHWHFVQSGGRGAWLLTALDEASQPRIQQLLGTARRMRNDGRLFEHGFRPKSIRPMIRHSRDLCAHLGPVHRHSVQLALLEAYVQRCDEDARVGLDSLAQAWQAQADEKTVELIALLNDDPHQDWLDAMDALPEHTGIGSRDAARAIEPGEPSHVRHIMQADIEARLRDVRAFDTLPDLPMPEQLDALRRAIDRLSYTLEVFVGLDTSDRSTRLLSACAAAQPAYVSICDPHVGAEKARQFAAKQRVTASGAVTFAEAQAKVIEARLPNWRAFLQPFL